MKFPNKQIRNTTSFKENNLEYIEMHKLLLENAVECIWLYDLAKKCFKYISPSIINLTGLTVEETMKEKLENSLTPQSLEKISKTIPKRLFRFLNGDRSQKVIWDINELQQYCKDGTIKTIETSTKFILNENTNYVDILGVSRDITERKKIELNLKNEINEKNEVIENMRKSEKRLSILMQKLIKKNNKLRNIAIKDKLTGLYNRYFFEENMVKKIEKIDFSNIPLTLIIFDLDRFKNINDIYGHYEGDRILKKVANTCIKLMSKYDIFTRWGGDEFVILVLQTDLDKVSILAEKLRCSIETTLNKDLGQVTLSLGIAERSDSESFKSWFKRADMALYQAKNNGGNCVVIG
ncbi:putative diguanylate cyclase YdaM [Clostridium puniceum]|uniref:Putative diguanylate cyclase YdaM n=1 Tax=Clostridium puniceum TaxID=29367 RepID=A0A1S8TBD3_9CLOT|nr:sensor domain-containing diguanylate cyclase [Clostridium puniceum]OOM75097.1 putative diguanylate cyclase YdaM [Clostridium puniceum]